VPCPDRARRVCSVLATGACALLNPAPAAAEEAATQLEEISVISTRTPRRADDVPASVGSIAAQRIEQEGMRDAKDLFRDEVDISVRQGPTRFTAAGAVTGRAGNESVNIRGLDGNRVLLMVDGVRLPNSFSFGAFGVGRLDFFSVDLLRSADVLRGPASVQYGSDGLAGAVDFRTPEPADLLPSGRTVGGFGRLSGAQVDSSVALTAGVALRAAEPAPRWQALLMGSVRRGSETDNQGDSGARDSTRTEPNPLDYRINAVLAKGALQLAPAHALKLTLEGFERTQDTEVLSAIAPAATTPTSVLGLLAEDRNRRARATLAYEFDDPNARLLQTARLSAYGQDTRTEQTSFEDRNTAPDRIRDNRYEQDLRGLSAQATSDIDAGTITHRLGYGLEWSREDISALRDGSVPPFGESFPVKPFPDTRYTLLGAYLQDELRLGSLSLIGSLRYDRYELEPEAAGFIGDVTELSDSALSPRVGFVWQASEQLAPYGQFSTGFRAPTPDQVNNGFSNAAAGYRSIGNPNLRAEDARSIELGVRGRLARGLSYSLAAYRNRYDDFIEQVVVSGSFTPADPAIFQFVNLSEARIRGWEARADWDLGAGFGLQAAVAQARGDSETEGVKTPLNSVDPLRATLGARYAAERWSLRALLTGARAKDAGRIAPAAAGQPAPFAAPGWATLDVGGSWQITDAMRLNAGIDNLFDRHYWRWSDVRGLASTSPVVDAFTAPGRNAWLNLRIDI
jgi:hemoglobin/transferrin/lactoferrin receptor protein